MSEEELIPHGLKWYGNVKDSTSFIRSKYWQYWANLHRKQRLSYIRIPYIYSRWSLSLTFGSSFRVNSICSPTMYSRQIPSNCWASLTSCLLSTTKSVTLNKIEWSFCTASWNLPPVVNWYADLWKRENSRETVQSLSLADALACYQANEQGDAGQSTSSYTFKIQYIHKLQTNIIIDFWNDL